MSRRSRHRRAMTRYAVQALKDAGKLGEVLETEPGSKAGRGIQSLISDVANEMAKESRGDGNRAPLESRMEQERTYLEHLIRDVPDFPKPGVIFKDITPLLADAEGLSLAIKCLTEPFRDMHIKKVVGAESRGFIFGAAVARDLSAGFVPIRKAGKLPCKTIGEPYELEYGADEIQVHADAVGRGDQILVVDDLIATGGTASACCRLVESLGGRIAGVAFLIELGFLGGREKIAKYPIHSVLHYN